MRAIIFSRDRAMQLHCLLDSLYTNADIFEKVVVIYKTDFYESYAILKSYFPKVKWIEQGSFKDDFIDSIGKGYNCLLVDDDIIFKEVHKSEVIAMMEECDIGSLRLGQTIKNNHHFEVKSSVDGNIFHRRDLRVLRGITFKNPNELEIRLTRHVADLTMAWFNEPRLIGIPNNRVSPTSGCAHMNGNVHELDDMYLQGFRIDWRAMNLVHDNVHKSEQFVLRNIHKDYTPC